MARKFQTFVRGPGGRIEKYSFKTAPSVRRLREVVRQAEKQGAKRAGIIAQVGEFQDYEMPDAEGRTIRDFRDRNTAQTPAGLLRHFQGKDIQGSNPSDKAILAELQRATGADKVAGLRTTTITFSY